MTLDARLRQYTAPTFAFAAILISVLVLASTFVAGKKSLHFSVRKDAELNAYLLRNAVQLYHEEYARLPVAPPQETAVSDGPFMDSILGYNLQSNPKKLRFAEFRAAKTKGKSPRSGLERGNKGAGNALVDPYGNPFHLCFDSDHDGKIAQPNPEASERWITGSVFIYSAGQDRDPTTWEDNISIQ